MSEFETCNCGCDSNCESCGSDCGMDFGMPNGTITLTLDNDTEVVCAVLTIYSVGDKEYIALLPLDEDGEVVCSTRLYVFHETMQDLRALKLLESLTDRQTVVDMLEEVNLFASYPRNNEYILKLREKINSMIKALTSLK